jgi:hypothetical protein
MSRDIIGTVKLAAQHFQGSPETVADVLQVEIRLRAEEHFREGKSATETYSAILEELPGTIPPKDKTRLLGIVLDEWKLSRLERGGRK